MNPINNPFSPGAGSPPPELVGREEILSQSNILLQRILKKRSEKSFLLTGLRGVGKTVLLNAIERQAEAVGYKTILVEAHEGKSLGILLIPYLKRLLFDLDRLPGAGDKVRRGLGVLKSFIANKTANCGAINCNIFPVAIIDVGIFGPVFEGIVILLALVSIKWFNFVGKDRICNFMYKGCFN